MNLTKTLTSLIILLLSFQTTFGQNYITILSDPGPLDLACDDSPEGYDVQAVQTWIDDYLLVFEVMNDCTDPDNEYTVTHDFTGQALPGPCTSTIDVTFTATNSCGMSSQQISPVAIEDFTPPPLGPPSISHHDLYCDNNGNIYGLQTLIDNDFFFTVEDDFCSGPVALQYAPIGSVCGSLTRDFYTADGCGNQSTSYIVSFNIIPLTIDFTSANYPVLESLNQAEVCLQLSNLSPVDITAEVSYTSGTATVDVDYFNFPITQQIVFPANSIAEQCFTVDLIEDMLIEETETIQLEITNLTSSYVAGLGSNNITTISILDNDDNDNDNVENSVDNCPNNFNPFQEDFDGDSIGDVCDTNTVIPSVAEFQNYIYINKTFSGVIVRSPDDQCWVMVVQNDGTLNTVSVECPN